MPPTRVAPVTLIAGSEDLLVSRAINELTATAREMDPAVEVTELDARTLGDDLLMDLATPSLFGVLRLVVIHAAEELDKKDNERLGAALASYVESPAPDVALVLVHATGAKGKRFVEAARRAGAPVVSCARLKPAEELGFVQQEFRRHGGAASVAACRAIVEALGSASAMKTGSAARRDVLGELAAAVGQLADDTAGTVEEADVARFLRGRAEASGFNLADYAVDGELGRALAELRFALATGLDPVLDQHYALEHAVIGVTAERAAGAR
ncbi:MAG: DNA polymerase III subunit delta [Frankia sp.]|nr:DNA polymerase III subunit delta [Frankia sp.]